MPAVNAAAVALMTLVHLARGQFEAHWACQRRHHIEYRLRRHRFRPSRKIRTMFVTLATMGDNALANREKLMDGIFFVL